MLLVTTLRRWCSPGRDGNTGCYRTGPRLSQLCPATSVTKGRSEAGPVPSTCMQAVRTLVKPLPSQGLASKNWMYATCSPRVCEPLRMLQSTIQSPSCTSAACINPNEPSLMLPPGFPRKVALKQRGNVAAGDGNMATRLSALGSGCSQAC